MNAKSQTLSVVLVTHNSAATLEKALESVRWADEIVVVDRGSTDHTVTIAQRFTDKIFYHPSPYLDVARHYGFQLAQSHWVLLLEPCEWVEDLLKHEIDGILLNSANRTDGFTVARRLWWKKHPLLHSSLFTEKQVRLFRKNVAHLAAMTPGTSPVPADATLRHLEHPLGTQPYPTLESVIDAVNCQSSTLAVRFLETQGQSQDPINPILIVAKAVWAFIESYFLRMGLRDGFGGLVTAMAHSQAVFMAWAKLRFMRV